MSFSATWDETKPAGGRDLNLGDDDIREFKKQVRERMAIDHYFNDSDDAKTGFHNKITLTEQGSDATAVSDAILLYAKASGGVSELFSIHESSAVTQLTLLGKLLASSLTIPSEAQGDILYRGASAWARLAAGTAGYYLTSGGAGADPSYTAPPASEFQSGMILMWSGSIATIPAGWYLCDGSNGTPNLVNRFVYGASDGANPGNASPGSTGGRTPVGNDNNVTAQTSATTAQQNSNADTQDAPPNHTHDCMPPYYALAFIMKA